MNGYDEWVFLNSIALVWYGMVLWLAVGYMENRLQLK